MAGRQAAARTCELRSVASQQLCIIWFAHDDFGIGTALIEYAGHPVQRATRAKTGDPIDQWFILKVAQYLHSGCALVYLSIGRVLELAGEVPAMGLRQLFGLRQHAAAFQRGRCQHHFRPEEAQEFAALDAEALCHNNY